ncbi:hypothetical protein A9Z42_0005410 [Trichoderma parareesei]|uniref:Uncharacterized protein n=1 Tax=Trichoderma parareesei TaxID=858221 RepID=A0A2H3AD24_TRIPA|nr:hypothetical protein A9Z42_0005410 [Trichoderma parareesei]
MANFKSSAITNPTERITRLREDYPAPDHLESGSISILSGGDFPSVQRSSTIDAIGDETAAKEAGPMAHYGLDGSAAPDKAGDGDTLRWLPDGHEMQSHSIRSRAAANEAQFFISNTLKRSTPLDGDSRLGDHKTAPGGQSELEPSLSRGELKSCGSQTLDLPDYQDKGVMMRRVFLLWEQNNTGRTLFLKRHLLEQANE